MMSQPEAIAEVQREFLAAGAEVVTTSTYQASRAGFAGIGLSAAESDALIAESARRARAVAATDPRHILTVGSVGPYGAILHDGSEYRGDYQLSIAELREFHRPRLAALAEDCDVLAFETIPQLREVEALLAELAVLDIPAWLSVSVDGKQLRSGESVAEAFTMAASVPQIVAVGGNCIDPADAVTIVELAAAAELPPIIYPNSGETWASGRWSGTPQAHTDATVWLRAGARAIGGCCRVGPAQIAAMATALEQFGHPNWQSHDRAPWNL